MHEVKPTVRYMYGLSDEDLHRVYLGYKQCYADNDAMDNLLKMEMTDTDEMSRFISKIMKSGHLSPLEHASTLWHIICSRSCSHQFVRHRIASFSQQSQRYVPMSDIPYIVPPLMREKPWIIANAVESAEKLYAESLDDGFKPEDAREILPSCVATEFVVTMNWRELLHFFNERCCNRAQWQIRNLAYQMLTVCQFLQPTIFDRAGAKCIAFGKCPEAKPCGELAAEQMKK